MANYNIIEVNGPLDLFFEKLKPKQTIVTKIEVQVGFFIVFGNLIYSYFSSFRVPLTPWVILKYVLERSQLPLTMVQRHQRVF